MGNMQKSNNEIKYEMILHLQFYLGLTIDKVGTFTGLKDIAVKVSALLLASFVPTRQGI